ncbi:MAG: NTP transferase domain-containing protein, partial [bacterium]
MASSFHIDSISAVILAGGRGSRMAGRDKGLLTLENRPLIETVLRQISTQIPSVMISANRNLDHYREYDVPVIPDSLEDFQGPLAGIAAALAYT